MQRDLKMKKFSCLNIRMKFVRKFYLIFNQKKKIKNWTI